MARTILNRQVFFGKIIRTVKISYQKRMPIRDMEEDLKMPEARVGKKAPDFKSAAYIRGKGFKEVKLSDYRGKWIVLCFYPGDFTFV